MEKEKISFEEYIKRFVKITVKGKNLYRFGLNWSDEKFMIKWYNEYVKP